VLENDFVFIYESSSFLSHSVTKLEKTTNLLAETVKEMNDIRDEPKRPMGRKLMQENKHFFTASAGKCYELCA
jgi:hypothetical protein